MQLFGVGVISTTALIPQQGPVALGAEILVVGPMQDRSSASLGHRQDGSDAVRECPVLYLRSFAEVLAGAGVLFFR